MKEKVEELEKDMTPVLLKDLGMRYPTENSKKKTRYGLYQCQYCGKEWEACTQNVEQGKVKSCGCQSTKYKNPHGLSSHPLYKTWYMMKDRCNSPTATSYIHYGARGVQVCDRWLDINNFIEDMFPSYQEGLTLDRIEGDGNYEPDNCRWVTQNIQVRNTRDIRSTNTSGYRGVHWNKGKAKFRASITVDKKIIYLGYHQTALEAAKAYERYVRLNNLEHNFTPALTEEEIEEINIKKLKY